MYVTCYSNHGNITCNMLTCSQTADQLLARADAAKALAGEAAEKGKATFREAEGILEDLRGTTY